MSYAVNLTIQGRPALVVGGGNVASRKVEDLLDAGADVTVIAPDVCTAIQQHAGSGRVQLNLRPYAPGDLRGAFLVIAATSDEELNARISRDAQSLGILVNVVDRPALCTFILPAVVRRGDFKLTISTEGQCPALASVMREELEGRYGPEFAEAVRVFAGLRRRMIALHWTSPRIREAIAGLYHAGLVCLIGTGNRAALEALIAQSLGDGFFPAVDPPDDCLPSPPVL